MVAKSYKVIYQGEVEETPRIRTLIRLAKEIGPIEAEITETDFGRITLLPIEERQRALVAVLQAKFHGEERVSLEILMRKDRVEIGEMLQRLREAGNQDFVDALIGAGVTQKSYTL